MSFAMSKSEREAFLAETRVGIVSIAQDGRPPLTVPVWYRYEPAGDVCFVTGPNSRKAALLKAAGHASFCVQDEAPPYRYVTVEGAVTFGPPDHERDVRAVAKRYLGDDMGEAYLAMTATERASDGEVLVRLRPARWATVDYRKMTG